MNTIWFKIYCGVGIVILVWFIVDLLWRRRDSLLGTAVTANEWMLVLAVVAWPVFLPIALWSWRRGRAEKTRYIKHDEEV